MIYSPAHGDTAFTVPLAPGPRVLGYELVTECEDVHSWGYSSVTRAAFALFSIRAHRCMSVSNGSSWSSNIPVGSMVA